MIEIETRNLEGFYRRNLKVFNRNHKKMRCPYKQRSAMKQNRKEESNTSTIQLLSSWADFPTNKGSTQTNKHHYKHRDCHQISTPNVMHKVLRPSRHAPKGTTTSLAITTTATILTHATSPSWNGRSYHEPK